MREHVLIGSTAMSHHFSDFPREPKDVDFACSEKVEINLKNIEYLWNPVLCEHSIYDIASPEELIFCGLG